MKQPKEITEERYYDLLGAVPPIYISSIDGEKIDRGFAVGEPLRHNRNGIVCIICYAVDVEGEESKYYEVEANIIDRSDFVKFVDNAVYKKCLAVT